MTRKEFEALRAEIQKHQFTIQNDCSPFRYAIERAEFRRQQLARLISLGRETKGSKTVQAKVVRWERQMKKLEGVTGRIATLNSQIR